MLQVRHDKLVHKINFVKRIILCLSLKCLRHGSSTKKLLSFCKDDNTTKKIIFWKNKCTVEQWLANDVKYNMFSCLIPLIWMLCYYGNFMNALKVWKYFKKYPVSRANNDNTNKVGIARWSTNWHFIIKTIFYKFDYITIYYRITFIKKCEKWVKFSTLNLLFSTLSLDIWLN